jgi:hypothetical protein
MNARIRFTLAALTAAVVLLLPAGTAHAAKRFGSALMCTQNGNHLCVSIPGPLFAGEQTWFDILGNGRTLYWDSAGTDSNGYPIGYVQTCGTCGPYYLQGNGGGNVPTLSASTSGVSGVVWVWVSGHLVNRAASGGDGHYGCALGSDNHNGDRARIQTWGTGPCTGGASGWYTAQNWG